MTTFERINTQNKCSKESSYTKFSLKHLGNIEARLIKQPNSVDTALRIHAKNKNLANDVDLKQIAAKSQGMLVLIL